MAKNTATEIACAVVLTKHGNIKTVLRGEDDALIGFQTFVTRAAAEKMADRKKGEQAQAARIILDRTL